MQSYPFRVPPGGATMISVQATLFAYESGAATPAGETRIRIKPDNGEEIVLRPGQSFRIPESMAQRWSITSFDGTSQIDGMAILGSGEFNDANAASLITLVAAQVAEAQAIPVKKQALGTIVNINPVNINTGAAQALVSDATLRMLRIRNGHATATLYLGGLGVTTANAVLVLGPGDLWTEEEAAGAAWYATSDTAATNVQMQGLK